VTWNFIGHSTTTDLIEQMISENRLSNAYLISGQKQLGKMTLAIDISAAVNCRNSNPPCNTCDQCLRIYSGVHTDLQVLSLDKVSNFRSIGIDDIRDSLSQVFLMPFEGNYRFIIVEDSHLLTREAANAFLKILEEPPPHLIVVLLTSDLNAILPTIISRCQQIILAPISTDEISASLINHWDADQEFANNIAQISGGSMGKAIELFSDPSILEIRNRRSEILLELINGTIIERFEYVSDLAFSENIEIHAILDLWLILCKNALLYGTVGNSITDFDVFFYKGLEKFGFSNKQVLLFIEEIRNAKELINLNVDKRLVLEQLMLSFPNMSNET
tara:strand:+ start:33829 stop:34824 length:996 start_codon:yes stop_codon:yes gene_type:complete